MVSHTSAMFESIAFHITRHESPVSYESAKENTPSPAKHSLKSGATKMSNLSVAQLAKELAMDHLPTADSTSQDVVFESHVYVPHSGTTLYDPSSTDSCSAGPSRVSTTSHATDVLGRSLKDAMVIDFGVMTVMCFAGSPLKRDDTFDRSVISGNEEASLITIQNMHMETPEASPRASPIDLPDPKVISIKTRNSQDRGLTHLSALHMPLTAMFAQHQVLTVISDEGPDDEDIELNCNVEPSTEINHTAIQNRLDTYPQYFSSDSKSPSVTSTLTSGSVSFVHQKIAVTLEEQNKSTLRDIALKKNPSSTYAHGCFPSQAHTNLDSSSHGSSADGNSTASTSPSTTLTSLVDNPVVKPSTWNDLFCNMNAGIQIFDFDDPDSPLALGCMSPTAAQVESLTRHDSKTSKSGDHVSSMALGCSSAKSNGVSLICEEHKDPSLFCDESIEDIAKKSKTCHSSNENDAPHISRNSLSAMINNVTERKTFDAILSNMERLTAFERVVGNQEVCNEDEDRDSCCDEFHPSSVQDVQSIAELETTKTEDELIPRSSESTESISFQEAGPSLDQVNKLRHSREGTSHEATTTNDKNVDELIRLEKEEEEAIRKAYYLHRRQLYLEAHAKSNAVSEARSFDDNDSEERPFDCGGPTDPTAPRSAMRHEKGTKAHAFSPRSTIEDHASASAPSINATYRQCKFGPRSFVTSGSPPPKPTLDELSQPGIFNTPKMMEHPLLQEMSRVPGDKNHTIPSSSDSVSSHLKIPSHPGSSEERTSIRGSPKNTDRSEGTLISSPTNGSVHSRHHRVNEGMSPNFGSCLQRTNALRLTDPGNRNNPRPTGSQTVHSKTSFQTTIETSLTENTENRHPHHRLISPRSTSDGSITAHKKSGTPLAIGSAGKNSPRACTGLTPESWNSYQQKTKTTPVVDSIDSQNRRRQSPENQGIASGCLYPKNPQATLMSDRGRRSFQRTTIASLAADSGISHRYVTSSTLATDSGSSHLMTSSFGSANDRGSHHNKSTALNLATESGSSSLESRTMQSESNSSHHRRTDRLNYLKMVRGVKIATRHPQ